MNPISLMLAPIRWGFGLVADATSEIHRQFRLISAPERHASLAPAVDLTPPVEPGEDIPAEATITPAPSAPEAGPGLPVQNYDRLSAVDAVSAVRGMNSIADLQAISRHERITKDRVSVVRAINEREAELASVQG